MNYEEEFDFEDQPEIRDDFIEVNDLDEFADEYIEMEMRGLMIFHVLPSYIEEFKQAQVSVFDKIKEDGIEVMVVPHENMSGQVVRTEFVKFD